MKRSAPGRRPKKRSEHLVVDELPDEVLVYDLDRHKAHCLNKTAALVWQHCDGKTTTTQIAQHLSSELKTPFSEDLVWLALRQLEKLHLLEQPILLPSKFVGIGRREMVRTLGIAAVVAVPLVTSIVSPRPAEAGTCAARGENCMVKSCCAGSTCNGSTCV